MSLSPSPNPITLALVQPAVVSDAVFIALEVPKVLHKGKVSSVNLEEKMLLTIKS